MLGDRSRADRLDTGPSPAPTSAPWPVRAGDMKGEKLMSSSAAKALCMWLLLSSPKGDSSHLSLLLVDPEAPPGQKVEKIK